MEHKLIIEVNVRFDEPQEKEEIKPLPKFQASPIDPSLLQNLLGPVLQALGNAQLNKQEQTQSGKEKGKKEK